MSYDRQIRIFQKMSEEFKDRLHLLLGTDQITFEPWGMCVLNKLLFINDGSTAVPTVKLHAKIEGKTEFNIFKKMCENSVEILDIIKQYTIMYGHVAKFSTKTVDLEALTDQDSVDLLTIIDDLVEKEEIEGATFQVCTTPEHQIEIVINRYGTVRKHIVECTYVFTKIIDGSKAYFPYTVEKEQLAGDIVYQVLHGLPTHIENN